MTNQSKNVYEAMFLVDSAIASANWEAITEAISTVMERGETEVISLRKWDERRLAYDIAGRKRGTYILCYFKADPEKIVGIERDVKLNEFLLRVLILRVDHMSKEDMLAPTPIMQREQSERSQASQDGDDEAGGRRQARPAAEAETGVAVEDAEENDDSNGDDDSNEDVDNE